MPVIGTKVRKLRTKLGLSVEELAEKAEVHPNTLKSIEIDKANPTISTLDKIASVLEVKPARLIS